MSLGRIRGRTTLSDTLNTPCIALYEAGLWIRRAERSGRLGPPNINSVALRDARSPGKPWLHNGRRRPRRMQVAPILGKLHAKSGILDLKMPLWAMTLTRIGTTCIARDDGAAIPSVDSEKKRHNLQSATRRS